MQKQRRLGIEDLVCLSRLLESVECHSLFSWKHVFFPFWRLHGEHPASVGVLFGCGLLGKITSDAFLLALAGGLDSLLAV